ncbi:unnamed protein product [Linum tenue]|uniref:Uncharacterized protein n=1 Tax=Linum tenue TaxID=586396 RepID=A0AAV0HJ25_9ROSI|nr:unnamed protein product [Linum tenue]
MTVVVGTHFQHSTLPFSSFRAKPVHVIVAKNSADCMNGRAAPIMISSDVATQHQQRRSGNYEPGQWGLDIPHQLLQAKYDNAAAANRTSAEYSGYSRLRIEELKRYVKGLLEKHVEENDETNMVKRLELIDAVQRLGLGYHFEREIQTALEAIIASSSSHKWAESLHACALRFRLLRQAGIPVSPDIFKGFKDDNGGFKAQIVRDVKGLLELYEASYLGLTGEDIMEEAKAFAVKHLTQIVHNNDANNVMMQVKHSLELPLQWRMQRAETSWSIQLCQDREHDISPLLQLAKLDFNLVQRLHQNELEELTSWWKNLGLIENLEFARDPLVVSFLWAIGITSHPEMGECRKAMAKVAVMVHIIDDVYDVYGYLDELELFTTAIERWDINELDKLPRYLQLCFLAVYNTGNEMSYVNLKQQGFNSMPYIQKAWADLCGSYLEEARAYHYGSIQNLEQYLRIASKSVASSIVLIQGYLFSPTEILQNDALDLFKDVDPNLTRLTSIIVRLTNDLASSKGELERGDVVKAVECCMRESKLSEEAAREHINWMIGEMWKMVNEDIWSSQGWLNNSSSNPMLPPTYVNLAVNVARASHYIYKHQNSKASSVVKDKSRAMTLLFDVL